MAQAAEGHGGAATAAAAAGPPLGVPPLWRFVVLIIAVMRKYPKSDSSKNGSDRMRSSRGTT